MSRVLVLDLSGPDSQDLVTHGTGLGHAVYALCHTGHRHLEDVVGTVATHFMDFSSVDAVADVVRLATANGIDGVTTASEFLTPLVTRVCAELGLPGNDPNLKEAPRNKIVMAECFARGGVAHPRTFVAGPDSDVSDQMAIAGLAYPVVVKPAENAGSRGVSIVPDMSGLTEAVVRARSQDDQYDIRLDRRVVVQEFIEGSEFSVESVTQHGSSMHICITRKFTTDGEFRVEIGHSIPADIHPGVRDRVLAEVTRALAAVGIRNAVTHTEVIVKPDGSCVVLEVAARIGAGRIGVLTELALGVSLPAASINLALGLPVNVNPTRHGHASSRLVMAPRAGRLMEIRNLPQPGGGVWSTMLTRSLGSVVSGPESNRCRVATFIVTGSDEEATNRHADELLGQVDVVVEPTETPER